MSPENQCSRSAARHDPVTTFILGLRVLGSEVTWMLLRLLSAFEICQLERRLRKERAEFDRLHSLWLAGRSNGDDMLLAKRQTEFLGEELDFLRNEIPMRRERFEASRRERWGLAD
jgi:hypothetical protein